MPHKLLLADDSVTIQRVVELTFSGEDVDVVAVGDGEEAIARIPVERPDVVLADIAMPKRNGYDVAAFVKGHPELRHIPVLLLAGAFEPVDEARAEEVSCDGVLVKPFEPQQVIARVRELLDPKPAARPAVPAPRTAAPPAGPRPIDRTAPKPLEFPRREEARTPPPAAPPAPVPEGPPSFDLSPARSTELEEPDSEPRWNVGGGDSLDDYFDRLDAAFTSFDPAPPRPGSGRDDDALDETLDVPTLDELIGPPDAPGPPGASRGFAPPSAVSPAPSEARGDRSLLSRAFTALLAVEEGEPGARPVRLTTVGAEPVVSDAVVEEITRRVIERLAPDAVRQVVAPVVSEVAERLVREEIARVRKRSQP